MTRSRNYLLLLLAAAITLPGCYTQLQTTHYHKSDGGEMAYYSDQPAQTSTYYSTRTSYADVQLDYRNYEVADWYRDHYVTPGISHNTYYYNTFNDYYLSHNYSPLWHNRFYTGFYHDPFYRSYFHSPWHRGFGSYWSMSFGVGFGMYNYPIYGGGGWYDSYYPYGYGYRFGYSYYPYSYGGSSKVDRDHRTGPRASGIQRTSDLTRGNRDYMESRDSQESGKGIRTSGTRSSVDRGNSGRTRSVDRDRSSRSRSRGTVNRGSNSSNRSSGNRSRGSGRDGQQTSSTDSYNSYEAAMKANTTARERAYRSYRTRTYQSSSQSQQQNNSNSNYDRDRDRSTRSYNYQQPVQFKFDNNKRSSSSRSRSYMRNTSNFNRSQGTTNFNRQSRSPSNHRINRSSSGGSRSSGNRSRSSSRSRSSGRDR